MKTLTIAIAALLSLAVTGAATASDIYKWTDEDGNVHYTDRPEGVQAERVGIDSSRTDQNRVLEMAQARVDAQADAVEAKDAAAASTAEQEKLHAENERLERNCKTARERMQQLVSGRRLYSRVEDGQRVYLDDDERLAAREKVENLISENCLL